MKDGQAELIDSADVRELRQPGVDEILIPSERAFREREQRRREGIVVERKVYDAIARL